ncbi:MAG: glycosyl hydrolase family 18 protein [Candidatus Dojkabacteria bacterium]|nr:glycosyl hydrolase family 18 protein [Candidatus Dojkabacteria bacterium]
MPKANKILLLVSICQSVAIVLLILTIVWIRQNVRNQTKNNMINVTTLSSNAEDITDLAEKIPLELNVSANLVWWDQDRGFESIEAHHELIDSISPFWYEYTSAGEIDTFSGAQDQDIIRYLKSTGISITPVISNEFQTEPLSSTLGKILEREKLKQGILEIAENYDGISLNFENLSTEAKDDYSNFVADLAEKLHDEGKTLTLHLHAKTSEPGTWNGPESQDWQKLGESCDKMKIMAYDYHWSTSEAGTVASPDWVEDIIKHAIELIPEKKIYLGIPLYGYDWIDKEGEGVTYGQALGLSEQYKAKIKTDKNSFSPYFSYSAKDGKHTVWFENAESTSYKLELAEKYNIGGIDLWRLGDEDPDTWNTILEILKK